MIVLALDTTTRAGGAALLRDGEILAASTGDPALTHGQRLPGELIDLIEASGLTLGDVDLFAVTAGPGSFTGMRIGIALVQGLAMATGKAVVPVSTFEALARSAADGRALVVPWIDAHRGEVFSALFDPAGRQTLDEPASLSPRATLTRLLPRVVDRDLRFVGDGAVRYAETISATLGPRAEILTDPPPLVVSLGRIALEAPERAVAPSAIVPVYVRRPDAEIARDRRVHPA
jgi:tRNA threonylcarbamoyladenosine biosynthesis protein TsaB